MKLSLQTTRLRCGPGVQMMLNFLITKIPQSQTTLGANCDRVYHKYLWGGGNEESRKTVFSLYIIYSVDEWPCNTLYTLVIHTNSLNIVFETIWPLYWLSVPLHTMTWDYIALDNSIATAFTIVTLFREASNLTLPHRQLRPLTAWVDDPTWRLDWPHPETVIYWKWYTLTWITLAQ